MYTPRHTPGRGAKLEDYESEVNTYQLPAFKSLGRDYFDGDAGDSSLRTPPATPQKRSTKSNTQTTGLLSPPATPDQRASHQPQIVWVKAEAEIASPPPSLGLFGNITRFASALYNYATSYGSPTSRSTSSILRNLESPRTTPLYPSLASLGAGVKGDNDDNKVAGKLKEEVPQNQGTSFPSPFRTTLSPNTSPSGFKLDLDECRPILPTKGPTLRKQPTAIPKIEQNRQLDLEEGSPHSSPLPSPKAQKRVSSNIKIETLPPSQTPQDATSSVKKKKKVPAKPYYDIFRHSTNIDVQNLPSVNVSGLKYLKKGVRLYPHQQIGVRWMIHMERTWKGGINADEMGLGKSLQAIALIAYFQEFPRLPKDPARPRRPTLIVCPKSIVDQWIAYIEEFSHLNCLKYHGNRRHQKDVNSFYLYDCAVTTYGIVRNEHKLKYSANPDLFDVTWDRIFLDEAQNAKNHTIQQAVACYDLKARTRWIVTGTPLQNGAMDFFSYFKFLQTDHLSDESHFKSNIAKPLDKNPSEPVATKLLLDVLSPIMIRRLKVDTLDLPEKHIVDIKCRFGDSERLVYEALKNKAAYVMQSFQRSATAQGREFCKAPSVLFLRLRQACSDPRLITKGIILEEDEVQVNEDEDATMSSGHCKICAAEEVDQEGEPTALPRRSRPSRYCLACSEGICRQLDKMQRDKEPSTKMKMLLKIVASIRRDRPGDKIAIASQWTQMLDLIAAFFDEQNVLFVQYTGDMSTTQRQKILYDIQNKADVQVLLVSLKTGGTGLNLTACNHLILFEPWWNPAVEDQAFDRIHRIGQEKPVFIYRLLIEDGTVEGRVLEIQNRKRQLAENLIEGTADSQKLTMRDVLSGLAFPS